MKLFDTPTHSYTDFYDIARFRLAWKINIILSFGLLALSIFFSFNNPISFSQYFAGFMIALTGVIYLRVTKKYITVSFFISIASLILVLSSLFLIKNTPHVIEPIWLIIIAIFSYFNLGKLVGHFVLFIVATFISIYFVFFMPFNDTLKDPLNEADILGNAIEFSLCMLIIGYFIYNFIETTAYAERKFRASNAELNEQNKMIQMQNEEKTVLLKEIHHRVKNNLQVIISLLRLQSSEIDSIETKAHFNDAINRIMTMSLIHQKMYQEKNLSLIDTSDYFKTLIEDLKNSSNLNIDISVKVISEFEKAGTKTIVPLALLISELVSNSLKHAFGDSGNINVSISSEINGSFILAYNDNGTWKNQGETSSFGLQLIQTLSEQLEGSYTRETGIDGTFYNFNLRNLDD